jgi:hypothetical protein
MDGAAEQPGESAPAVTEDQQVASTPQHLAEGNTTQPSGQPDPVLGLDATAPAAAQVAEGSVPQQQAQPAQPAEGTAAGDAPAAAAAVPAAEPTGVITDQQQATGQGASATAAEPSQEAAALAAQPAAAPGQVGAAALAFLLLRRLWLCMPWSWAFLVLTFLSTRKRALAKSRPTLLCRTPPRLLFMTTQPGLLIMLLLRVPLLRQLTIHTILMSILRPAMIPAAIIALTGRTIAPTQVSGMYPAHDCPGERNEASDLQPGRAPPGSCSLALGKLNDLVNGAKV